jgi:hypothetical protein
MRLTTALALTSLMVLSTPVFAQSVGAPGATGDCAACSGHNPPGGEGYGTGDTPEYYGAPPERRLHEGRASAEESFGSSRQPSGGTNQY